MATTETSGSAPVTDAQSWRSARSVPISGRYGGEMTAPTAGKSWIELRIDIDPIDPNSPVADRVSGDHGHTTPGPAIPGEDQGRQGHDHGAGILVRCLAVALFIFAVEAASPGVGQAERQGFVSCLSCSARRVESIIRLRCAAVTRPHRSCREAQ